VKRKVEVTLLGQRFTVRSEKDEAYVHGLAGYVARKYDELKRSARTTSRDQLALLVALNLADELFQQIDRAASTRDEVRRHSEALVQKLAAALALAPPDEEEPLEEEVELVAAAVDRRA
jgi:cell division protein ZapA (FtsZ GTPase activity inhibitor)